MINTIHNQSNIFKCGKKRQNQGQGLVEYIALTALVAIVSIGTIKVLGTKVRSHLNKVASSFDRTMKTGLRSRTANADATEENDDDPDVSRSQSRTERSAPSLPRNFRLPLPW